MGPWPRPLAATSIAPPRTGPAAHLLRRSPFPPQVVTVQPSGLSSSHDNKVRLLMVRRSGRCERQWRALGLPGPPPPCNGRPPAAAASAAAARSFAVAPPEPSRWGAPARNSARCGPAAAAPARPPPPARALVACPAPETTPPAVPQRILGSMGASSSAPKSACASCRRSQTAPCWRPPRARRAAPRGCGASSTTACSRHVRDPAPAASRAPRGVRALPSGPHKPPAAV
jgi:hypothetical protein